MRPACRSSREYRGTVSDATTLAPYSALLDAGQTADDLLALVDLELTRLHALLCILRGSA